MVGGAATKRPGAESSPAPVDALGAHGLERLALRLIAAGEDPELPARGAFPNAARPLEEASVARDRIIFKNAIPLPASGDPHPVFLVWEESALGVAIQNAFYTHRVLDSLNRLRGEFRRDSVSLDRETRRWFIPLADLLGGRNIDADPADLQLLGLDLQLADGRRVELEVQFRLLGPLPSIQHRVVVSSVPADPKHWGETLAREGWVLAREELVNPSGRSLQLWIRDPVGTDSLRFAWSLANSHFEQHGNAPPVGPMERKFWSEGALSIGALGIRRAEGFEEIQLGQGSQKTEDGWIRIELRQRERLALEWKLTRTTEAGRCPLPVSEAKVFHWITSIEKRCPPRSGEMGCLPTVREIPKSQSVVEGWRLEGAQLSGAFARQAFVTDAFLSAEEAVGSLANDPLNRSRILELPLALERLSLESGHGVGGREAQSAWGCKGLF